MIDNSSRTAEPFEQPINLWFLVMGETGEGRKGTAHSAAEQMLRHVDENFWKRHLTPSLSSGEGLIYAVRDGMDEEEIERREASDKPGKIDYGVHDKRLLVISTEFATIMAKGQGGTLGPVLRDAWDGKDLAILTMDSHYATAPHITLIGQVTPEEFAARLRPGELAGGTYNRLLPTFVHKVRDLPWPERPEGHKEQLLKFAARFRDAVTFGRTGCEVRFSRAAKDFYTGSIYPEYVNSSGDSEVMKQFTTRRLPYLVRVAAAYALVEQHERVEVEDLVAAKSVVDYAIESARYVLSKHQVAKTHSRQADKPRIDIEDDAQKLIEELRRNQSEGGEGINRTELYALFGWRRNKREIDEILQATSGHVTATSVAIPGSRKPRTIYCLAQAKQDN
ncbi:DUF3987 domain-containing protein [Streptomyces cacaoi]|nr:DUF3987 domain-containing protein [Streptomyces cacaoi]